MSVAAAFLSDIIADPDDDTPRLIYADWLDDHDDPDRGEFIRVQCRLARHSPTTDSRLLQREQDLLREHRARWLHHLPDWVSSSAIFRRGFVEEISGPALYFLASAPQLFRATPLRTVCLGDA